MQVDILIKTVLSEIKKSKVEDLDSKFLEDKTVKFFFDFAKEAWSDPFSILFLSIV